MTADSDDAYTERFAAMTDQVINLPKPRQELKDLRAEKAGLLRHLEIAHETIVELGGECDACRPTQE